MKNTIIGFILGVSLSLSGMAFGEFLFPDNPQKSNYYFSFGNDEQDGRDRLNALRSRSRALRDDPCP